MLLTTSRAKSCSPSHPKHFIDSVRANSASRCTGTRSPSQRQISDCPVPAAWELQRDVRGVGEGSPQLTLRDRGLLRVLPGPPAGTCRRCAPLQSQVRPSPFLLMPGGTAACQKRQLLPFVCSWASAAPLY